ncbi:MULTISPECIES: DUF4332 domain-containing protein [unclassified Chelatococcus]|uniref:DUF4332 domain-containing protein n=1 Tax=unclassified Chelatococcus TaxID=2638111 RepID=UPI001BD12F32|nr:MULTISPECIES: DUF4332 domain-containing protein [unclassified Chelatococcus]MBS7698428.1 DUF4332 domain-containing protein [Chelatococcus sp. YT9]MBX3559494.1 DUF4332 domain-containing protein [Chelatococcus sp.]
MASYSIVAIEGIGAVHAARLKAAGVTTTEKLLERGKDPKGRSELALATGIDERYILRWTNHADLMRIKGIAEEYSELLEAAGVDTVNELRHRHAAHLAKALAAVNEKRKLVRAVPPESVVTGWIEQAKRLPPVMTY